MDLTYSSVRNTLYFVLISNGIDGVFVQPMDTSDCSVDCICGTGPDGLSCQ